MLSQICGALLAIQCADLFYLMLWPTIGDVFICEPAVLVRQSVLFGALELNKVLRTCKLNIAKCLAEYFYTQINDNVNASPKAN